MSEGYGEHTHRDDPSANADRPYSAFPFEFSKDVPADTTRDSTETVVREVPFDGYLVEVAAAWQSGSNNQAGLQFRRRNGEVFLPRNEEDHYVAFPGGGGVHPFAVVSPVREGEELVAEYINTDTSNSHFVNCVATIRGGGN